MGQHSRGGAIATDQSVIVILEDDVQRREEMTKCLSEALPAIPMQFFTTSSALISFLKSGGEAALFSLDHDLELECLPDGKLKDAGTGRDVADFLAQWDPECSVLIHSTNTAAAAGMEFVLSEANWDVRRIVPYDDIEWIRQAWLPLVMERLPERTES